MMKMIIKNKYTMKHLKSYNESIVSQGLKDMLNDYINWKLIDDAKDMSLEYLDQGMRLTLWADYGVNKGTSKELYSISYCHEYQNEDIINPSIYTRCYLEYGGTVRYGMFLDDFNSGVCFEESKELVDRLKEAYPDEIIYFFD